MQRLRTTTDAVALACFWPFGAVPVVRAADPEPPYKTKYRVVLRMMVESLSQSALAVSDPHRVAGFSIQLFVEEIGCDDLSRVSVIGRRRQVDNRPVGQLGELGSDGGNTRTRDT